jgi:hypothetical protein
LSTAVAGHLQNFQINFLEGIAKPAVFIVDGGNCVVLGLDYFMYPHGEVLSLEKKLKYALLTYK